MQQKEMETFMIWNCIFSAKAWKVGTNHLVVSREMKDGVIARHGNTFQEVR